MTIGTKCSLNPTDATRIPLENVFLFLSHIVHPTLPSVQTLRIMEAASTALSTTNAWQINVTTFDSFDDTFVQISTLPHRVRGNLKVDRRDKRSL
jgi:hypothetical protein